MNRSVLFALALSMSVCGFAQVVNVGEVTKVDLPQAAKVAAISPQGDYLLLTSDANQGLTKFDLATGESSVLTKAAGAGYNVKISDDGQNVVYREKSTNKARLQQTAVQSRNFATGEVKNLVKPTRDLNAVAIEGNSVMTVNKRKMQAKSLDSNKARKGTVLYTENYQLMVSENGKARQFSPLGANRRYIWPALSPDGTKALFFVSGDGAYVCNLDGSGMQRLGTLRAAKWLNDNVIVGMNDTDNGEITTASQIVAVNLQGQRQVLTDDSLIAMYPQVGNNKIAFSTRDGEAYIINLK